MQFELATVISCDANGCRVNPVDGGPALDTRYSARAQGRVIFHPGQLVAVNMDPAVPEVSWRWHRARVVETGESAVLVQDHDRQISVTRMPGLEVRVDVGDEVFVTGFGGDMELHDRVVGGNPSDPSRLREKVFPRIAQFLVNVER